MKNLHKFLNAKISTKISFFFLLISIIPLAIVSFLSVESSIATIEEEKRNELLTLARLRIDKLERYITERITNVSTSTHNPFMVEAFNNLTSLYESNGINSAEYISYEEKHLLYFQFYLEQNKFYDAFLIRPDGEILYTVKKEVDLGTNLITGPYNNSELAKVFEASSTLLEPDVSNFENYEPSGDAAAFIAAPVFKENTLLGVFAVQLGLQEASNLANDYVGLGKTGEIVIAKKSQDKALFVVSTRHDPNAALNLKIQLGSKKALPIQKAVQGVEGFGISVDYRGKEVLAAWNYSPTFRWGVVLKIDKEEVYAGAYHLRNIQLIIIVIASLLIMPISFSISKFISKPIVEITKVSKQISKGILVDEVDVSSTDEIGELAHAFQQMTDTLRDISQVAEKLATGDTSVRVKQKSEDDVLAVSINKMVDTLNAAASYADVISSGDYTANFEPRGDKDRLGIALRQMKSQIYERTLELEKSEEMNRGIINTAIDSIFSINKEGVILDCNIVGEKMFGYSTEEFIGQKINILMPASESAKHDNYLKNYLTTGVKKIIGAGREVVAQRKDGSTFPIHLSIGELKQNGESIFTGFIKDITLQKKAETAMDRAIHELSERNWISEKVVKMNEASQGVREPGEFAESVISELCTLLEAGHGAFYVNLENDNHRETEVVLELLGSYAFREIKNVSSRFKLGEGLVGQSALEKKQILLTNVPSDYIQITSGLGESTPLNIMVLPVLFETELLGVIELATFKEFSSRQKSFLEEAVKNLGVILNSVLSGQRTTALLQETQRQSEELQSQHEELETANESLQDQAHHLKASEQELMSQGEVLRASNEELEEKTEALEIQKRQVEKAKMALELRTQDLAMASKYKSEFLANMSHELRTPLNSFLLLSKSLSENKKGNLDKDQLEDIKIIHEGGFDLLNIINDIMDLSKVKAGKLILQIEEVDLNRTLENISKLFNPTAANKKLKFEVNFSKKVPASIETDSQRLQQILKNFLSNAFKFTSRGKVELKVHLAEQSTHFFFESLIPESILAFSVIDSGIGIPEDKQREIFEAFQQQDGSTSRKYGGTGLGLTISRELAKKLGGEIHLQSVPGQGSTFTLFLPLQGSIPANLAKCLVLK